MSDPFTSDPFALSLSLARHRLRWRVASIGPPDFTGLRRVRMACQVADHTFLVGGGWLRSPDDLRTERNAIKGDERPLAFGGQLHTPAVRVPVEFEPAEGLSLGDLDGLAGAIGWDLEAGMEGLCAEVRRASVAAWEKWRRDGGEVGSEGGQGVDGGGMADDPAIR